MILESFPVGALACNCTILGDEESGEAIVIDPGDEVGRIHRRLTENRLQLKQILVTHAHIDHIGGALRLKRLTGAPILLNENDLPLLASMKAEPQLAEHLERGGLRLRRRSALASAARQVLAVLPRAQNGRAA